MVTSPELYVDEFGMFVPFVVTVTAGFADIESPDGTETVEALVEYCTWILETTLEVSDGVKVIV